MTVTFETQNCYMSSVCYDVKRSYSSAVQNYHAKALLFMNLTTLGIANAEDKLGKIVICYFTLNT